jgi:hypothetical protein
VISEILNVVEVPWYWFYRVILASLLALAILIYV